MQATSWQRAAGQMYDTENYGRRAMYALQEELGWALIFMLPAAKIRMRVQLTPLQQMYIDEIYSLERLGANTIYALSPLFKRECEDLWCRLWPFGKPLVRAVQAYERVRPVELTSKKAKCFEDIFGEMARVLQLPSEDESIEFIETQDVWTEENVG